MMGSGGLIVMDEDNCMVDIAKFFLEFTVDESCGKCTPCRIGTKRLLRDAEQDHRRQRHHGGSRHAWKSCCYYIKDNALCGLGQTAPEPRAVHPEATSGDEYEAHIVEKRCPAGVCKAC